jgi:hypothetical protein
MLILSVSTNVYSQTKSHSKWKYPMIPAADSGTVLNKVRAEKIMKIANYTIDHNQVDIGHNPADEAGKPFQAFRTHITIDSVTYNIMVSNPQTKEYTTGFLMVSLKYKSINGSETDIMMTDQGFDGLFNFGVRTVGTYDAIGNKNQDIEQSLLFQNDSDRWYRLENGPYFQNIGDNALDQIVTYIIGK